MMPFGQLNSVVISVSQNYPLTKVITYQRFIKNSYKIFLKSYTSIDKTHHPCYIINT